MSRSILTTFNCGQKALVPGVTEFAIAPDSQRIVARVGIGFYMIPMTGGSALPIAPQEFGGDIHVAADSSKFFYLGGNGNPALFAHFSGRTCCDCVLGSLQL